MLILEGAQARLSWITILKRRENYRQAFDDFDVQKVANYTDSDRKRLLADTGISAIKNARAFINIQREYGTFSEYIWGYVNHQPIINHYNDKSQVPVTTPLAEKLSKDLKKRGMSFVALVIMYSYMQSVGMVDDHTLDCFIRQKR